MIIRNSIKSYKAYHQCCVPKSGEAGPKVGCISVVCELCLFCVCIHKQTTITQQPLFFLFLSFLSSPLLYILFVPMPNITQLKADDLKLAHSKPSLIAVSPIVSIQTALNLLQNNKITSLPVFSHNSTQVVSIVNLFDILLYLMGRSDTVDNTASKLDHPVEYVLGLDSDRESYRMHKTDSQDTLLEAS